MNPSPLEPHHRPSSLTALRTLVLSTNLALAIVLSVSSAPAQTEGSWTAARSDTHLRIALRWGTSSTSFSVAVSEARGLLEREITSPTSAPVAFRIEREPGVLAFEGAFEQGSGEGRFRFEPNRGFAAALRSLGVSDTEQFDEPALLALTVADASVATVRELATLGVDPLDARGIIELALFGVTPEYVREIRSAGVPGTTLATALVRLRIAGIGPAYVRELEALGYRDLPLPQLVEFGILGVTPEYIRELRKAGFRDLSPEDLVRLKMFRGEPEPRRSRSRPER